MIQLYRARLALVAATLVAAVVLATQLPLGELLHQRTQLSAAASELSVVEAHNRQLSGDVALLRERSTIATIAHQEYGLVLPGQRAYVVLPAQARGATSSGLLDAGRLPAIDLVAGDTAALAGTGIGAGPAAARPAGSLWSKVFGRLAFWRWAF